MACLIEFYGIKDWYLKTFSEKEKVFITNVIPFLNKEDYNNISKPLYLAITDCFINVSFLPPKVWETKLHIPIDEKLFKKALEVFYESNSSPMEKHLFYNKMIEKRAFMKSVYDDPLIKQLCNEQINNSIDAKNDFLANKIKLPNHEGYSTLIRINKSSDENKYIELCKEALAQGWKGSWKRMLNYIEEKKLQEKAISEGNLDIGIFKKKLPMENEEFSKQYWDKNNNVFCPANRAIHDGREVYFLVFNNNILQSRIKVTSINFKRGDIFIELESQQNIKIPMNMELLESYIDYNHVDFSAIFFGCNKWRVSENSDVPDCKYIITTFERDDTNPLLNRNAAIDDVRVSKTIFNGVTMKSDGLSTSFEIAPDEVNDEIWKNFFSHIKELTDDEETIIVTVYKNQKEGTTSDKIILQGTLTEINSDSTNFSIGIDDNIININETTDNLDLFIPDDDSSIFGYFPCTIKQEECNTDAIVFFATLKDVNISSTEDDSDEDYEFSDNTENDITDENAQSWQSLFENIDIMFKIQEPVFFAIIDSDTKNVIINEELSGISFDNGLAIFSFDEDNSFSFDMSTTIISLDCDLKTRMFSAIFKSNFVIDENNTKKELSVFITNKK